MTDENGEYTFSGLRLRTYQVRQLMVRGDTQTLPAENGAYEVRLDAVRHDVGGRDFGSLSAPQRETLLSMIDESVASSFKSAVRQTTAPVCLFRAIMVPCGPPGQQTSWAPSTNGDSA